MNEHLDYNDVRRLATRPDTGEPDALDAKASVRHVVTGAMVRERMRLLVLVERRKRASQSLRTAATEMGVAPSTLLRFEAGHTPDLLTFARICAWVEIDPCRVLFDRDCGRPATRPA